MLALVAFCFAITASFARAELTSSGDLLIKFSGGVEPNMLPRHRPQPVSVRVSSEVKTISGKRPPALRRISIAINSGGHLDTRGLPICREREIVPTTSSQALANCGRALVGEGSYGADVAYPEQHSFPSRGRVLAFNSMVHGHHAILAHVFGVKPVPTTLIIVFIIRKHSGTFGTVLTASISKKVIRYGYLNHLSLDLHREYTYRGRSHSYLSAVCAAPAGFPGAVFPFAQAKMTFEGGRTLSSTITRGCKVRRT